MRASAGLRGLVILLAGECAVGALFDGFLEDASHKDIRFWSSRDPSAFVPEGTAGCAKMTLDGKPGRSARVLSEAEGDRMRSLHTPYTRGHIDGTDIAVEGTWAWSDGAVFYRDGFCTQAHCAWGVDQPDNANDEDHLELFADNRWNDVPADFQEVFYCEFPCRSHADCEGPLHCTPQGRCAEDGTAYTALSGGNWSLGADIDFWVSNESMSSLAEADRNCGSMFRGGRQGRPAMVLSAAEEARLVAANPQSKSIGIGGRYSASADQWQWPDGSPVSSGTFCLQSYCGYFNPGGKNVFSYIKIRRPGLWVGANLEEVDLACEFPCVTDADCTAPGHMCHWQGRCVVKAKAACAAYAKTAFSTGYMSEGDDLMFWLSTTVEWGSLARFRCAEMCYDGRRGRGSRIKSDSEYDRIAALLQDNNLQWAYLAGANDVAKEGTFYWDTDEKPMSIKLPNGENDCRQHDCYWEGDQPDNAGNENYLLMWNHHTAGVLLNDYLDNQVIYVCEFPCTRDADCKNSSYICDGQGRCTMKDQCANYGKVLLSEGVLETSADDIAFWHSGAAAVASRGDHVDRCADLCYHGRKGRPLRALTSQDANRVAQFTGARMDGYPSVNQALWKWMDGTPFYDGASSTQNVVPGCLQDHCAWPTGQAFDAALPSTHIAINPDGEWLPSASVTPSSFLCEFPCVSDEDCNDGADPAGLSRVCHSQGRCVVQSNCSGVGDEILSAGKWSIAATDIRFWASESKHVHTDNVDAFCAGLCHDGRAGRLARITSESEQQRVSNLGVAGGLIDGNDLTEDGVWMYSDGTVFWTERQNCLQEYCNWLPTRPLTQSPSLSYLSMTPTGPWTDVSAGTYPFYCEFPCIGDADCNGEDVLCPPYKCTALGRCVVNPKCFKTTDCKYLRLEDACSANERCEWVDVPNQMGTCASKPCRQATKDACTAVATCEWSTACASDACMEKRCTSDLRDVCVTDERCAWEDPLQPDDCERAVCGEYASEGCCRRQPHCEWNTAASPAFCKEERCRAEHKTAADCSADESCIWQDGACEKVECPGTNECDCKRAKGCIWDEGAKTCASEAFVLCPAVDVVVLLDGSSTMAMSFGRHPHGFFALVETLRDWIEQLPLTGTKAGVAATAQTPGMRVGFVQYASLHNLPVASVAAAALGGTGGSVSGDAGQLSADLDWHEDNFINGASKVEKGLALAKQLFDATLQTSPRVKVIYIISDGPAKDSEAVSAANGAGTPLGDLQTDGVEVFGILIRRTAATTPADTAALGSLKLLLSADVDDHAAALEMHALADSVLYRICDPTGPFGDALAAKTNEPAVAGKHKPCFVYAESHACSLDSGCAWDGVERECVDSVCVRICDAGACALAPGHLCEWSAGDGCVKATVCALTDKAACEASPQKCSWAAAACRKTPCVSVGSELACATDPDDCTWWTINGAAHCIETPCKGPTPAACAADSLCAWTIVDPCDPQAGSSCQLAGCILYRNRTECLADSRCVLDPDDQCQNDPCFEYADELCCDRRAECAWNTSTSPASCRLGPCYAVGTEPACEADEACMWAAAAGGCVDLDCRAFGAQCACNQRPGCFWKNSRVPECTAAKYGVCPTMDVVVVFDGSLNMNQQFGRHPAGFVAVIEALRTWASELPLSSESASIGDESPRATELVRLAFVQAVSVASPSDAVSGVAVAPATGGRLSGNRTELHADLDWHEDVQGPGMAAGFTPALRKANRVFERDVPMADETRRRVLLVVSGGSFDASLADAEVDNLELLGVERFGIALRRAETATAADKAATASLGKLVSPLTDQHVVSALVDELPGILGSICDPNAAWGSIVITEQSRVSPDQHLPCVHHLGETPCQADHGCAWDPAAAACRNSPCLAVCGAAACPEVAAANCTWGGVFCIETPVNDCECDFGGLEQSVAEHLCGDARTCRWNATSGSCRRDVCGAGSTARATCANNGQTCVEAGSGDSLCPSWSCDCVAPQALVQQPLEQAATCVLSECATQCASCVAAAGCGDHQVCKDPDISPGALNDWSCECLPPYSGAALGRSAACRIDECAVECPHCANGTCSAAMFNQTCVDPDHTTMGDWRCVCPYPANQSGLAMAAPSCDVDECLFYGGVCAGAEQTCVDGSLFELDNWRCVCPPPAVGTGVNRGRRRRPAASARHRVGCARRRPELQQAVSRVRRLFVVRGAVPRLAQPVYPRPAVLRRHVGRSRAARGQDHDRGHRVHRLPFRPRPVRNPDRRARRHCARANHRRLRRPVRPPAQEPHQRSCG
ncbi:hypothetical protein DIPPA_29091 [Diplonema papillatum]|nr:hypothetical protein DIPPA_29091 [Diplonema papillatum]